ncbi:hypothetical protein [Aeromicrobium chenweiae]|uniref:Uncharacterized protein n=1 Tax=Aeromicrobium chenweiae TaxID=2079793 RepID=A0A2S0WQT8_9ACTN|nr:hypothetical protein [Aeromicrobium chenweiae]AWB93660.1 hypothetical protein C3E78_16370 [Aeromicrobium chenweiae]TGN30491.1 hypothetical protein E4L97_17625 [Aeromicrobium chenweiae]
MRLNTLARTGAALTASALVITLSSGPANAADSTSVGAVESSAPAAGQRTSFASADFRAAGTVRPAAISLAKFKLRSGVMTSGKLTGIWGDVIPAGSGSVKYAVTKVTVNGKYKGQTYLYPGDQAQGGINMPRIWGSGPVVLGPTTFTYADGSTSVDQTRSNTFYFRKNIKTTHKNGSALKIRRVNKKVTFKAQNIKIVQPSTGKYVSVKRVKLQYKKGSKWKTQKTIKLNSKGNGTYKRKTSSKKRYRLYLPQTATTVQFRTYTSSKI